MVPAQILRDLVSVENDSMSVSLTEKNLMETDIEAIIRHLSAERPDVQVKRLNASHKADDDGIWFFSAGGTIEVQLESANGNFPILIESNSNERRTTVDAVDQAINVICSELGLT